MFANTLMVNIFKRCNCRYYLNTWKELILKIRIMGKTAGNLETLGSYCLATLTRPLPLQCPTRSLLQPICHVGNRQKTISLMLLAIALLLGALLSLAIVHGR